MISENVTYNYHVSVDLFKSADDTSLHMPLSMLSMTSTPVENSEGSIFVVPPSKRNQSHYSAGLNLEYLQLQTRIQTQSPHNFFIMHD